MGFHRRIITEEVTKKYIDSDKLEVLYSSESLIFMDEFSSQVFEYFKNGKINEEILLLINKEKK
jgi:hypothetical protein